MKRRLLSAAFGIVLALSVFGNSVYASGMESAGVPAVAVEAGESVETAESAEPEASTEVSAQESAEAGESVETPAEETEPEESADAPAGDSEEAENPAGEGTEAEDPAETEAPTGSSEESGEPDESAEESSEPTESTEEGSEPDESGAEDSEPAESTEDGSGAGDPTEDGSEPDESTEAEGSLPEESESDGAETEESEEDEEFISDEEISEVYYAATSDGWSFQITNGYATITGYTGKNTALNVPATVKDSDTGSLYAVKAIGASAFGNSWTDAADKSITSVTLPNSVTDIGNYAFCGCSNLKKIHLGSGVTTIGEYAFAYSGITGIIFPKSVTSLRQYALYECDSLGALEIDCQATTIPNAFARNCDNLRIVRVGESVDMVYSNAFQGTPQLKAVYTDSTYVRQNDFRYGDSSDGMRQPDAMFYSPDGKALPTMYKPTLEVVEDADSRGVLMTTDTPGAIIFYSTTSDKMDLETDWVASGNGVDFSFFKGTVYARTYLCGQWSAATSITLTERKLAKPTFAVKGVFGGREVTFNTTQKGAVIYYSAKGSTDISTASAKAENGQSVLFENFYGNIYAKTYYNGVWSDATYFTLKIPVVNDPVITYSGDKVTIRTTTPDAFIYYTTDGSTPSINNGKRLSKSGGTFTLPSGTVKAIAVRSCFTNSNVVSRKITPVVDSSIKVPSFKVVGVVGGRTVTFSTAQKGAVIYYSSSSSTLTTADKKVNNGQSVLFEDFYGTIYARTYYNGKWSNVARLILKIPVVNRPSITRSSGYATIITSTPNCTIYYTTDGSTPSPTNGKRINASSGKVYVGYGVTVKAIAVRSCFTNSPVTTYY